MVDKSNLHLLLKIKELEARLEEAEQLIEAIKAGEVDAFAINQEDESQVFTLQSGDYAYRVLIEEFGEGAINVSEEGVILYANPYFSELLQLSYEEVIGKSIFEFIESESKIPFEALFGKALSGQSKGEINMAVGDRMIPVYVSLTSLQPKLATIGIIITDFTEKKKNEEIILEYQKKLVSKNLELIRSNAELASFVYIASHDLQEPLRKIQMFAGRITDKETTGLTSTAKDYFTRMQNAAGRMQNLIEDLLAYSRTNTADHDFEKISIHKIIEEVQTDLKEELQQKRATIEVEDAPEVNVIPFQFRQLMTNLISNSLKFSNPDLPPHIKIKNKLANGSLPCKAKLNPEKEYWHISVSDNGIGFEEQYNEKIFGLFQRLHGKSEYSGTGIGLAIVKKIVENHNGAIMAKAEVDKGATFDIFIPAT